MRKSFAEKTEVHLPDGEHRSQARDYQGEDLLSTTVSSLCVAVLLVFSNHFPASLVSPELCLSGILGDTLEGGFALSLAVPAIEPVEAECAMCPLGFWNRGLEGPCRRDTDLWAGGRRG